jgi:quercetin dioxygenase-like cupin family protein
MNARPATPQVQARYYPRAALTMQPDVPGARFWAVGLEHALLTCFEVDPNTHFPRHAHASEQITYVLEGELVFVLDDCEVPIVVGAGEAIAIPSQVPHAVHSRERGARAVDAWSPLPAAYSQPLPTEHPEGTRA